jgi:hypothetical protein
MGQQSGFFVVIRYRNSENLVGSLQSAGEKSNLTQRI